MCFCVAISLIAHQTQKYKTVIFCCCRICDKDSPAPLRSVSLDMGGSEGKYTRRQSSSSPPPPPLPPQNSASPRVFADSNLKPSAVSSSNGSHNGTSDGTPNGSFVVGTPMTASAAPVPPPKRESPATIAAKGKLKHDF